MRKSKQFMAMPVISLEEGQQIGTIKGLIVDPVKKEVSALLIEQKGWFQEQKFIPFKQINSVGNDAITIEKSTSIQKSTSIPDIFRLYKEKVEIIGTKVVTENGIALGYVDEFYVGLETGALTGIEFSGKFINSILKGKAFLETSFIRTIGKEVVVTYQGALDNIVKIDGGIQETVKNLKDSTNHLWENTLKKTREISSNLSSNLHKPFEKDKKEHSNQDELNLTKTGNTDNVTVEENTNPVEKKEQENSKLIK